MPINSNFANWANSLTGCDGGDIINSDIWVCGIEWGWGKDKSQTQTDYEARLRKYYSEELSKEMEEIGEHKNDEYDILGETGYQFGQKFSKLYAVIRGHELADHLEVARRSLRTEIYKMNLYPIAFPDTKQDYWSKYGLSNVTGIETRELYLAWCRVHRFPCFANSVKNYRPKLIIGTGTSYTADFILAFGGELGLTNLERETVMPDSSRNGRAREIYFASIGETTTLVVTPFFGGYYGLNSDHLIREVGKKILKRVPDLATAVVLPD